MSARSKRLLAALPLLAALSGCCFFEGPIYDCPLTGRFYSHYTYPVVSDMNHTPRGTKRVMLDSHYAEAPFTRGLVNAEWHSRAIGDAAKRHGLDNVYFADMHVLTIFGVYRRQRIEVWGD
jgi:hypothetical protein